MRRKYLNRIEVWQRSGTSDSYAGLLPSDQKIADSWCNISTVRRSKLVEYGLNIDQQAIEVRLRYRSDIDYFQDDIFFKYKGSDWTIKAIENIGLNDYEISILAWKQ